MSTAVLLKRNAPATEEHIPWILEGTHSFLIKQGVQIVLNDGNSRSAHLFNMFSEQLNNGVLWVDSGLKSACHYYDPYNGSGIWFWPNAAKKCSEFFLRALEMWKNKKHYQSMFLLGAAVHLVQDLCVPHHASCKVFCGHQHYEDWAGKRKLEYRVDSKGIYDISYNPEDWIVENARFAKEYYPMVDNNSTEGYHRATQSLLPRAQLTTAGFLLLFYDRIKKM
ncbi:MAG: zinc dependent phospholipase C family protein [Bacillota bacterium]